MNEYCVCVRVSFYVSPKLQLFGTEQYDICLIPPKSFVTLVLLLWHSSALFLLSKNDTYCKVRSLVAIIIICNMGSSNCYKPRFLFNKWAFVFYSHVLWLQHVSYCCYIAATVSTIHSSLVQFDCAATRWFYGLNNVIKCFSSNKNSSAYLCLVAHVGWTHCVTHTDKSS